MGLIFVLTYLPSITSLLIKADLYLKDEISRQDKGYLPDHDFIFLGLDENTLTLSSDTEVDISGYTTHDGARALELMQQPFPWNREVYGRIIERAIKNGADLVMIDFMFAQPSEGDDYLTKVIDTYRHKIVLAAIIDAQSDANGFNQIRIIEPLEDFLGPLEDETPFGMVVYAPESDGIIRNSQLELKRSEITGKAATWGEMTYSSFSYKAAQLLGYNSSPQDRIKLPYLQDQKYGAYTDIYKSVSIADFFHDKYWEKNFQNGEKLEGKVVMVGPAFDNSQDKHYTTHGQIFGAQIHLHVLAALKNNAWWKEVFVYRSSSLFFAIIILAVLWVGLSNIFTSKISTLAISYSLSLIVWFLTSWICFTQDILFAGLLFPILTTAGSSGSIIYRAIEETIQRKSLASHLSRSMSPEVAKAIANAPDGYYTASAGKRLPVTMLFSDIRGFTSRSEKLELTELIGQLNTYFDSMVKVIFSHRGTIDKFIGDAIMATWGELGTIPVKEQVNEAVKAAEAMLAALKAVNDELNLKGDGQLKIGLGVHHGDVIVGELGSAERTDFTVIGDAVNLSSRLESLTSQFGLRLIISEEVYDIASLESAYSFIGNFIVKGRKTPVALYTLSSDVNEDFTSFVTAMEAKDHAELIKLSESQEDKLSLFYKNYLGELDQATPWDGNFSMLSK